MFFACPDSLVAKSYPTLWVVLPCDEGQLISSARIGLRESPAMFIVCRT